MGPIIQVVTQREAAGAQRVADQLCGVFRARGVASDVWFLYPKADAFVGRGYRDIAPDRPSPSGLPRLWLRLFRDLRASRPIAVIAHTHHAIVFTTTAALFARVPVRVAAHHTLRTYESAPRVAVLRVLRLLRVISADVFVSDVSRASHRVALGRQAFVVHNGVDAVASGDEPWSNDPRADQSVPLVVAVGRLAPQKDHRTLIDAIAAVPDVHLVIIGEGDLRADLESRVEQLGLDERVSLIGSVEQSEVLDALHAADVVVQPSEWEAFSMVILEAMAQGKPLLVSDIAPHREALGGAARYHRQGDADSLASSLRGLLGDAESRRTLADSARRRAGLFTVDRMADRYLDIVAGRAGRDGENP